MQKISKPQRQTSKEENTERIRLTEKNKMAKVIPSLSIITLNVNN